LLLLQQGLVLKRRLLPQRSVHYHHFIINVRFGEKAFGDI
jgi:hypothetical protein